MACRKGELSKAMMDAAASGGPARLPLLVPQLPDNARLLQRRGINCRCARAAIAMPQRRGHDRLPLAKASTPRNSASAHCSAAFSNHFVASTGPPAQRNAGDGRASSETSTLEVFQHFSRFKNSFRGLFDKSIDALDASTHLKNIHEAVVKHAVGLVR